MSSNASADALTAAEYKECEAVPAKGCGAPRGRA